jgi:Nif-specific regulatory protein
MDFSEVDQLSLLLEISQILDQSMDLKQVVTPVLNLLGDTLGFKKAVLTLLNRQTGEIVTESSLGLSNAQKEKGRYKLGEGITGRVIQNGEPLVVPHIAEDPVFLDKTGSRKDQEDQEVSFVCVPVIQGNQTIGALSADLPLQEEPQLLRAVDLLKVINSMIAQAVKLRQEMEEEKQSLVEENSRLKDAIQEKYRPSNIIGKAHAMQQLFDMIAQVAGSDATVLVRGESGTGKELIAQAIHYNSPRSSQPFVKVNCAALPESVIESELFGHEKGAFTGAISTRKGRFELADGGTIFLDEIGDLSTPTQVKLLRVLQEREIERVGGAKTIKVNVRVIAATNRNLEEAIAMNEFREDLYYRLNVFPLHIPPLRERKSDILLLADHFVTKYNKKNNKSVKRISTSAINMLMSYHWPGNVRELENVMERGILLATNDVIHAHHLPPTLQTAESSGTTLTSSLQDALEAVEKELILDALKSSRGNFSKAARALNITERIMGLRAKKYGIDKNYILKYL